MDEPTQRAIDLPLNGQGANQCPHTNSLYTPKDEHHTAQREHAMQVEALLRQPTDNGPLHFLSPLMAEIRNILGPWHHERPARSAAQHKAQLLRALQDKYGR